MKQSMSISRLRELLHYDAATGVITRLVAPKRSLIKVGDIAGSPDSDGYLQISVEGKRFKAHRIAWALMTGAWPENLVDHKNGVKGDNRWNNLRDVTNAVNSQNQIRANAKNTHGFMGASPNRNCWVAGIKVDGKSRCIGTYKTPELAHEAYIKAKRELHAGCTI